MVQFNDLCDCADEPVGNHFHRVLTGQIANRQTGVEATASVIPGHYASEERIARALARLGKPAAAELIEGKLPTSKQIRSGDLGEIYATEWIDTQSGGFRALIKRLRWKDHRNMAMRGDDVIGMLEDPATHRLVFIKAEAKSRAKLTNQVLTTTHGFAKEFRQLYQGTLIAAGRCDRASAQGAMAIHCCCCKQI